MGRTLDALLFELRVLWINEGESSENQVVGITKFSISEGVLEEAEQVMFRMEKVRSVSWTRY